MTLLLAILASVWACIYTTSFTVHLWRSRNYRGAVGTAILALAVLIVPPLVQWNRIH